MRPIYIACLHNVRTGGPEALHQLSDALISQGFDARTVYYTWDQIAVLERSPSQEGYVFGVRTTEFEEYERYKVNVSDRIPNTEGTIVVLPETLCHLAPKFAKATVLIWWLSVDNGFGALSRVNLNLLRQSNVRHAYQSDYARHLLEALSLPIAGPLSDYTTGILVPPIPWADRRKLVLFNAGHKVTADLQAIADELGELDPEIECIPIRNLSRLELCDLYAQARVYVDLGSFPGKDRGPREAVMMGCNVVCGNGGAGGYDFDRAGMPLGRSLVQHILILANAVTQFSSIGIPPDLERKQFLAEAETLFRGL